MNSKNLRLIIYGAGAIGGAVGGHLARTGSDVALIGRPGHMKAIREDGLRFITPTGTHVLRLPAVTAPDQIDFGPDDVVLLCVKGQDTDEALRELRRVTDNVPIFCFQNGVRNEEIAAGYFPKVYGVKVSLAATYLTDGEVTARSDPPGVLIIGRYPSGADDLAHAVATKLRVAGFLVLVTPDVMPYKWGKLMVNLANAVNGITDGVEGDDYRRVARAAKKEAREILAEAGIRWISNAELALEWPESAVQPLSIPDSKIRSSTLQSLARRQGTVETDFFNGEIVQTARRLGKKAPINEMLVRITQEMAAGHELPGKYTPEQLCQLLGLD